MEDVVIVLNNIRSSENVGSILRSADAFCIHEVYLVGLTPAPIDRFGRDNNKVLKASLGAEKTVNWQKTANLKDLLEKLRKEGFYIVAIEQTDRSFDFREFDFVSKGKVALVFGEEVKGLSTEEVGLCDSSVEIPIGGSLVRNRSQSYKGKESLNVAVAAGIILSRLV